MAKRTAPPPPDWQDLGPAERNSREAEMRRFMRKLRQDRPRLPFQHGPHIDSMPVEDNPQVVDNMLLVLVHDD